MEIYLGLYMLLYRKKNNSKYQIYGYIKFIFEYQCMSSFCYYDFCIYELFFEILFDM